MCLVAVGGIGRGYGGGGGVWEGIFCTGSEMAASAGAGVTGGGGGVAGTAAGTTRKFKLQKENELRVEVGMDSPLKLQLVVGTAEIFGTELPPMFWMTFPAGHKFAVSCHFILLDFFPNSSPRFECI